MKSKGDITQPLLSVKNLKTHIFLSSGTVKAVDGVSFDINKQETLGIVGESGSGKSMTALSILGLLPKPAGKIVDGSIIFDGKDLTRLSPREMEKIRGKSISMIFQDPMTSIDPVFRIGDQLVEVIREHLAVSKQEAREKALKALSLVGIPEPEIRFNAYPHEFSGGMRQRVIIAMAIVCAPRLIIADEPTTALDVTVQAQVLSLLKDLQKETGTPILIITHNLGVVWKMCDSVMVMYAGKTVETAAAGRLYENPIHPYTWGLLDSIPSLNQNAENPLRAIEGNPPDPRLTGDSCAFAPRCAYATEICSRKAPPLIEVEDGHFAACHHQTTDRNLTRRQDR